jgi:hypothetical protein
MDVQASEERGVVTYRKTPREISVVERGGRECSSIKLFAPGRSTLERLVNDTDPTYLNAFLAHHGYGAELERRGFARPSSTDSTTARDAYIATALAVSDERLAEAIERERLLPRAPPASAYVTRSAANDEPPPMSTATKGIAVRASDEGLNGGGAAATAGASESTPMDTDSTPQAASPSSSSPAAAAAPAPATPTTASLSTTEKPAAAAADGLDRSITTPSMNEAPVDFAKKAIEYKQESTARMQELLKEREARAAAEAAVAANKEALERLAAYDAEKKAEQERLVAKRVEALVDVETAFRQHMAAMKQPPAKINDQVEAAKRLFEVDPDLAINNLRTTLDIAMQCNKAMHDAAAAHDAGAVSATQAYNQRSISTHARELALIEQQDAALQRHAYARPLSATSSSSASASAASLSPAPLPATFVTPSALAARMEPVSRGVALATPTSIAASIAAAEAPNAAAAAFQAAAATAEAATRKRPIEYEQKQASPTHFSVQCAEPDLDYPAAKIRANFKAVHGRDPSMAELAHGICYGATGETRQSADGLTVEPVFEEYQLRATPAYISPWNNNPRLADACDDALKSLASQQRGHGKYRLVAVEGPALEDA